VVPLLIIVFVVPFPEEPPLVVDPPLAALGLTVGS